ncbi:hypothetical protein SARC_05639 [Sphaeroforma arctica JP610]|uniref:Uncharacterized protein n=1 Tax=Sphaeroforma arctica JP610 TaxID=667725 RepID=A0A0L0FZ22_9EUKA|nr:hypothetical protein SARC_05639 [Sphaeroforma arctica JP610]KNC82067.1 hypothetical protein SARC_05639 [Sphaeroforma arctica JP610]|eukprot:XP_014155969.1 hypothetical protein SARC_05639 [Sphaeroforma arctica JP610]
MRANEGHSDNLEQENKVQEKVKAIKDRIQRLLQQSNYDAGVASGVLQSSDEQENTCIAPTPIPLPPYDDDLRFEGGFDTRRTGPQYL